MSKNAKGIIIGIVIGMVIHYAWMSYANGKTVS